LSITRLPNETETGGEFVCDVASRKRLMDIVAERAQVPELIRRSLIYQASLLFPAMAEFQ
jgi:hypothetical protein